MVNLKNYHARTVNSLAPPTCQSLKCIKHHNFGPVGPPIAVCSYIFNCCFIPQPYFVVNIVLLVLLYCDYHEQYHIVPPLLWRTKSAKIK